MPGLGGDIADVLKELGSVVDIYDHSTNTTVQEYVDPEQGLSRGSPFMTQYVRTCTMYHNTQGKLGNLLKFVNQNEYFLFVAQAPEIFEGSTIVNEALLYKCNTLVQFKRRIKVPGSEENNYTPQTEWKDIHYAGEEPELVHLFFGLFTGHLSSVELSTKDFGNIVIEKNQLFVTNHINIKAGDRAVLKASEEDEGENHEVEVVERFKMPGIKICKLKEDTRG